jgi:hypothetical protein
MLFNSLIATEKEKKNVPTITAWEVRIGCEAA